MRARIVYTQSTTVTVRRQNVAQISRNYVIIRTGEWEDLSKRLGYDLRVNQVILSWAFRREVPRGIHAWAINVRKG